MGAFSGLFVLTLKAFPSRRGSEIYVALKRSRQAREAISWRSNFTTPE